MFKFAIGIFALKQYKNKAKLSLRKAPQAARKNPMTERILKALKKAGEVGSAINRKYFTFVVLNPLAGITCVLRK